MTPVSQAPALPELATPDLVTPAAPGLAHAPGHLHAPSPGATATLIHDLRELFKVKVVGMVLVTGWGGFYLASMQSGISSVQPGLLDALFGIGLVSAGAGALNEALERKTDARMIRTAQRPLACGRFSLAEGILAGLSAIILGAVWLLLRTNLLTVSLALLTAFCYVAIYTPLKRFTTLATFIGAFPGAMGPLLGWTAARPHIEWPAVALFAILFVWQFPHFMAISWLYRDDYARAGIRMLPVVQPDVHRRRGAVLRRGHDSRQPRSLVSRRRQPGLRGTGCPARPALPGLYHPFRRNSARQRRDRKPHAGPRSAQSQRPLPALALHHAHALRHKAALRNPNTMTTTVAPSSSTRPAIAAILVISAAATLFLFWLIYVHPAAALSTQYAFLPALNAILNGLSATALLIGYTFIRSHRVQAHRAAMITAFIFSTLFLVSYIVHHALHGDVRYPHDAPLRMVYLPLLASHIVLAIVALPLVLVTFFFSLTGRIRQHRKVARWTFPLWLYVSVTGVITYVMLRLAQG